MRLVAIALAPLLLSAVAEGADVPKPDLDVTACMERNIPEPDSIRAVRFASRDRTGARTVTTVKMYGRRTDDGFRQLYVRFIEPEDMRGASLLILEGENDSEIYFASTEFEKPRRITGVGQFAPVFGTDFSYEDLTYLQGFKKSAASKRLPDEDIDDHSVYVVEIHPEKSAYERIVMFVDKTSCMPLTMKFYKNGKLRKELTTDPKSILKHGSTWVAHITTMRDHRDFSTTQLFVDSHEQDVLLPKGIFTVEALQDSLR